MLLQGVPHVFDSLLVLFEGAKEYDGMKFRERLKEIEQVPPLAVFACCRVIRPQNRRKREWQSYRAKSSNRSSV